jgi:hypothetical protein
MSSLPKTLCRWYSDALVEGDVKHGERPGITGELEVVGGELLPGDVLPV